MESSSTRFFETGFFHSPKCFWDSSMLLHHWLVFLLLNSFPVHACTTVCLSVHPLKAIGADSSFDKESSWKYLCTNLSCESCLHFFKVNTKLLCQFGSFFFPMDYAFLVWCLRTLPNVRSQRFSAKLSSKVL